MWYNLRMKIRVLASFLRRQAFGIAILAKQFQSSKSRQGIVVTKAMGTKHNQKKYGNK